MRLIIDLGTNDKISLLYNYISNRGKTCQFQTGFLRAIKLCFQIEFKIQHIHNALNDTLTYLYTAIDYRSSDFADFCFFSVHPRHLVGSTYTGETVTQCSPSMNPADSHSLTCT